MDDRISSPESTQTHSGMQGEPRPLWYGSLKLSSRYLLSPLAGFTNLPFRRVCREIGGVGLCTTDLVSARGILEQTPKSLQLIETCPEDSPFSVQIFGSVPSEMSQAAQWLESRGVHSVDINMGCPVNRIVGSGAGSAMMCQTEGKTLELVQQVVEAVKIPVTVKMRLGWDDENLTAPFFAKEFEQIGIAAVAIHGRTRAQGFSGSVNLDGIRQVVESVNIIPVIANGDMRNVNDVQQMFEVTGCQGISIGRGALANPWIFRQLVEYETTGVAQPPGNFDERLALMIRQFSFLREQVGDDRAVKMFRKMGHWYLKAMCVHKSLRHRFQLAADLNEIHDSIQEIRQAGPMYGHRTGLLPEMHVPVPNGPVERW